MIMHYLEMISHMENVEFIKYEIRTLYYMNLNILLNVMFTICNVYLM